MNSRLLSGTKSNDVPYCRRIIWTSDGKDRRELEYRLKTNRQSRKMTVRWDGRCVSVVIPPWVTVGRADRFVFDQLGWIEKRRAAYNERSELFSGKWFPYRGAQAALVLDAPNNGMYFTNGRWEMHLSRPTDSPQRVLADAFEKEIRKAARKVLDESFRRVSERASRKAVLWRLSGAKGRWGSCNCRKGYINLSWRLIGVSDRMIDYVVAHELAHLIEANHSPAFWGEVEKIDPDYRESVRAFKEIREDLFPGI